MFLSDQNESDIADSFYQSSSSGGVSADDGKSPDNVEAVGCNLSPTRMAEQVGGISKHKHPVMTMKPHFLLKPLRLHTIRKRESKDGIKNVTKTYRGIRELAFYESIQSASDLASTDELLADLYRFIYKLDTRGSVLRILTLCSSIHETTNSCGHSLDTLPLLVAFFLGDPSTVRMIKSYVQSCCNHLEEMKSLGRLAVFTSPYYGLFDLNDSNGDTATQQPYLLLRDLTAPFDRPNVIDIKMGTQTYEPTAPLSKQHREFNKYPQQSDIGFRIVAMRMYSFGEDKYQYRDKSFGTSLQSRRDIVDALTMFFSGAFGTSLLLSRLIDELNEIKTWFEEQNASLAFYSSSILIIYEGSPTNTLIDPSLKMIDFAHVCRKKGGDKGYLRGIENLICILSEIQSKG
jgi:1D-myo-inositol-tetrakisphosphate 5-kinase/inositol-polyphosphate multikinase